MLGKYRKVITALLIVLLVLFQSGIYQVSTAFTQELENVQEEPADPVEDSDSEEIENPSGEVEDSADELAESPAIEEPEEPASEGEESEEQPPIVPLLVIVHNVTQNTYYDTITEAIDAANNGDEIEVAPGTYTEQVRVNVGNLTLRSISGPEVTILTGNNPILEVTVDSVTIQGFSFINSDTGIQVHSITDGNVTVQDCYFNDGIMHSILFGEIHDSEVHLEGNHMDESWRGFYFEEEIFDSSIRIIDNDFIGIKARGVNFAKDIQTTYINISSNTFTGDTSQSATGIYTYASQKDYGIYDHSEVIIFNNTFTDFSESAVYIYYIDESTSAQIDRNTFSDCYYGIEIDYVGYFEMDEGCEVQIFGNTFEDVYYGVYVGDIYYHSLVSIHHNTMENVSYGVYVYDLYYESSMYIRWNTMSSGYSGVYIYYLEGKSVATIEGNTISDYDYGIDIDYIGYDGPEDPCYVYILDNEIYRCETGITIDDYYYGTMIVEGNNLVNCYNGIYIDDLAYDEVVDVKIINNTIVVTEDLSLNGLTRSDFGYAIYFYNTADSTMIAGNTIAGTDVNKYNHGIYSSYNGYNSAEPMELAILENDVSYCNHAIYMNYLPYDAVGSFNISGNNFHHNDYAFYVTNLGGMESRIELTENLFSQNNHGLYVGSMKDNGAPSEFKISGNRFIANFQGISFDNLDLAENGSWLGIFSNDFINNIMGIRFSSISIADPTMLSVTGNNFTGNVDYSIYNQTEYTINALNNWWGHPDGPVVGNKIKPVSITADQMEGDPVSLFVLFDPWISTVVLTPATATGDTGTAKTFTASIYNSNSQLVTAAGISVRFVVTGAHSRTGTVGVGGGTAAYTYTGGSAGTDGVWATVVFGGEDTTLRDSSVMVWTGAVTPPGDDDEPLPDTGMDTAFIWLGLASITSGVLIRRKKVA